MILVTGSAGFIGSNLVAELSDGGLPVAVCDRLGSEGKWKNLAGANLVELVPPEELPELLARSGSEITFVYHMGAISSTLELDADLVVRVNFRLSQELWRFC